MKKYRVKCVFMVASEVIVEADSKEQAAWVAEQEAQLPLRETWEYLEGSFEGEEPELIATVKCESCGQVVNLEDCEITGASTGYVFCCECHDEINAETGLPYFE